MDSLGTYEDCAKFLVGQIATLVPVPREKDFGIDFYCQPRVPDGPRTEIVTELCALQIKGGTETLAYGGLDRKGMWREYEFAWLRSLATPLYLVRVEAGCKAVALFSLWPMWLVFWQQVPHPFQVVFTTDPPGTSEWRDPHASSQADASDHGDGKRWTVNLGPPFLRLVGESFDDPRFYQHAVAILRTRIVYDRLMLMRYHQFIPVLTGITRWSTNSPEILETRNWQFWSPVPGINIPRLSQTSAPMVVNLGIHLQWQNDVAAYRLVPILEWFDAHGHLDPIGRGLLDGLRATQAAGGGPATTPHTSVPSAVTPGKKGANDKARIKERAPEQRTEGAKIANVRDKLKRKRGGKRPARGRSPSQ